MTPLPHLPSDALVRDPYGAHEPPIYQTSTFTFEHAADAAAMFAGEQPGFVYTRIGNPTVAMWEKRAAELETAGTDIVAGALAFATGMGAISAAVLATVSAGDHVVAMAPVYAGTDALLRDLLPRFGVRASIVPPGDMVALGIAAAEPRTKAIVIETPGNPTLDIVDIRRSAEIARAARARLIVDNTFATPVLQKPLALGADIVVHSATKFLGGHGNVVSGVVITADIPFLAERVGDMRKVLGAAPSPFDAWLLWHGSKTLELRVLQATATSRVLAKALAQHDLVEWVRWPGLESDPGFAVASRQMKDFGAVLSFGIRGGVEAGIAFMDALGLAKRAVSLGCSDTLIEHPASMTHAHLSPEARAQAGIADNLIRVSVGLESADELLRDVLQSLAVVARRTAAVPAD